LVWGPRELSYLLCLVWLINLVAPLFSLSLSLLCSSSCMLNSAGFDSSINKEVRKNFRKTVTTPNSRTYFITLCSKNGFNELLKHSRMATLEYLESGGPTGCRRPTGSIRPRIFGCRHRQWFNKNFSKIMMDFFVGLRFSVKIALNIFLLLNSLWVISPS